MRVLPLSPLLPVAWVVLWLGVAPSPSSARNVVLEWNQVVLAALKRDTSSPLLVTRNLAILHLSIEAAVDREAPEKMEMAAIGAAFFTAQTLFPSHQADFEQLRARQLTVRGNPANLQEVFARAETTARRVINSRVNDGSAIHVSYVPRSEPGQWRRTPPTFRPPELAQWATRVKPFVLTRRDQFRPAGPPDLRSKAWAAAFHESKAIGAKDSPVRTAEQTTIAKFWSDFSSTETPPGHWNTIACSLAAERRLSLTESAQLFARLNVALADAGIACWDAKYHFNFWRPVTAIQRGDQDENVATEPRRDWQTLLNTPPHPEYPSGHSTFSGAAVAILSAAFGGDQVRFTVRSDALPGMERTFTSLRACAEECGASRVYAGIHFRFSCDDGLKLGRDVGEWTVRQGARRSEPAGH